MRLGGVDAKGPSLLPRSARWRSLGLVALGALLTLLLVTGASAASGLLGGPDTDLRVVIAIIAAIPASTCRSRSLRRDSGAGASDESYLERLWSNQSETRYCKRLENT
jgi:hypothetical protein